MDISQLDGSEATYKMPLLHPSTEEQLLDDSGEPMWIELYGIDSDAYAKSEREFINKRMNKMMKGKQSGETALEQGIRRLVSCTADLNVQLGGQKVENTASEITKLYEGFRWIRDQVEEAVYERSNFFKS